MRVRAEVQSEKYRARMREESGEKTEFETSLSLCFSLCFCGAAGIRTRVQTGNQTAFYMLSILLIVGNRPAKCNLPEPYLLNFAGASKRCTNYLRMLSFPVRGLQRSTSGKGGNAIALQLFPTTFSLRIKQLKRSFRRLLVWNVLYGLSPMARHAY